MGTSDGSSYDFNYSDHYSVHLYAEKICGRNGGRSSQGIMRQEKEKRFMKAKTLKKGLGIALSMAMTMSLFGCGSGGFCKRTGIGYFGNYRGCREYRLKRF